MLKIDNAEPHSDCWAEVIQALLFDCGCMGIVVGLAYLRTDANSEFYVGTGIVMGL